MHSSGRMMVLLLLLASFSGCKMAWRAVRYNVPSVNDYKYWQERPVQRAGEVHGFRDGSHLGIPPASEWGLERWYKDGMNTEQYLESTGTVAFVVLRGDTLLYEYYGPGYDGSSRFNPFSMTKVYVSVLTGIALSEGFIRDIDQSISEYLPWCTDSLLCKVSIRDLLQMTSGIHSTEGYLNPWATSTKLYYGDQTEKIVHNLKMAREPGKKFFYQNINSQLLGMVISQATHRPLASYLSEKIWQPLGMEADAGWSISEDSDAEKSYCCLNARARDFARFGLLVLNEGKWQGEQLIPKEWLQQSTSIDTSKGSPQRYQFNWYLTADKEDFWAEGMLGQYTYICPKTRTVIVRIGEGLRYNIPWYDSFKILAGIRKKPKPLEVDRKWLKQFEGKYVFGPSNQGDTTLVGKTAKMIAKRKGLKVRNKTNKPWLARPDSDSTFYYISAGRMLTFHKDSTGTVNGLEWYRRGNTWELKKTEGK